MSHEGMSSRRDETLILSGFQVWSSFRLELCADDIVSAAARRRSKKIGGGVGGQKHFFRFTKEFRSILKIFLGTFLVIKALRFADDQC